MPAAKSTNSPQDGSVQGINVVFKRQLLNPDDAMLEEQYWRQAGIGGKTTFDGGGESDASLSEGEIVVDKNPNEPRMFHVREYEIPERKISPEVQTVSPREATKKKKEEGPLMFHIREYAAPGRKISRDVRVVSQPDPSKNDEVEPEEGEDTQHLSVPSEDNRYLPVAKPQRKISWDVKVHDNVTSSKDDGYGTEGTQPILNKIFQEVLDPSLSQDMEAIPSKHKPGFETKPFSQEYSRDDPYGTLTDRTIHLDSPRSQNSLPKNKYHSKLQEYYNFDQPKGSVVDPRTYQNAKRATRASILTKAESLLNDRKLVLLDDHSSDDDVIFPVRTKPKRRGSPYKRGGHSTDTELNRKVKEREKNLTSPEVDTIRSPRLRKQTFVVPKPKPDVPKRKPFVPKRPANVWKRPGNVQQNQPKKREAEFNGSPTNEDTIQYPDEEDTYEDVQIGSPPDNSPPDTSPYMQSSPLLSPPIKSQPESECQQSSPEETSLDLQNKENVKKQQRKRNSSLNNARERTKTKPKVKKKPKEYSRVDIWKNPRRKDSQKNQESPTDTQSEATTKSDTTQQISENEDDVTTTDGDVTARRGQKGPRYEDGPNGPNTFPAGLRDPNRNLPNDPAQRVAFYNFKVKNQPTVIEAVSKQRFPTFESLLDTLTHKLQVEKGANFVYHWPSCARITNVDHFRRDETYIVSNTAMKKAQIESVYGHLGPRHWHNGKVKYNDSSLIRKPPSGLDSPGNNSGQGKRALIVKLVCNSTKIENVVILNTNRPFEELMAEQITDSVNLKRPPACTLYDFTDGIVGSEIRSLSQLLQYYRRAKDPYMSRYHGTFLVCGREMVPESWVNPTYPHSHSSDSYRPPVRPRNKYPPGADSAPPRVDILQNGDNSPRSSGVHNGIPPPLERYDTVKVKIQGRRREFHPNVYYDRDEDTSKPDRKLMLDWVYGYRGNDRHKNLDMLYTGELVYYVASVVVLLDKHTYVNTQQHQQLRQRFYTGHNEDISCLTIHPDHRRIATGQIQGKGSDHAAHIRIWDVHTLSTLSVIGLGSFQGGITCISFSVTNPFNSEVIMAIDESFRHTMSIWDVQGDTEKMLGKTTTSTEAVTGGCFYPYDEDIIITYGRQHLYFWRLDWDGERGLYARILRDKLSGYSEDDIPTNFTALAFSSNGEVVTGDSNGSVMVWQPNHDSIFAINRQESDINSHQSAVTCVTNYGDGMMLSSAGNEILLWDTTNRHKNPDRVQTGISGNIQAMVTSTISHEGGIIYVGTDRNSILAGYLHHNFNTIIQGMCGDSAHIAVHQHEPAFISACRDMVIKWSLISHQHIWKARIEGEKCTAVAVNPVKTRNPERDSTIALGTKSGKIVLLNYNNRGREENTCVIGAKKINAVMFSPDGLRIAIAVDDGYLHICSVDRGMIGRLHATSNVHGLSMTNIDWSLDCRFLQTSSTDFQVFFWNVEKKPRTIPGSKVKDTDWFTHKSIVSHSILGPWQQLEAGETIRTVDRTYYKNGYKELLVTGDNVGRLQLFRFPCSSADSECREVKAYSGSVNCVEFSSDECFIMSAASVPVNGDLKNHLGIMQWALVDQEFPVAQHSYPYHYPPHYQHHYPYPHYRRFQQY